MSDVTLISSGSNTTVLSTPGKLYGIHVSDANGGVVLVADAINLGATPNYNVATQSGLIERIGPLQNAGPVTVNFHGARLYSGLTIAATSSAKVTAFYGT